LISAGLQNSYYDAALLKQAGCAEKSEDVEL